MVRTVVSKLVTRGPPEEDWGLGWEGGQADRPPYLAQLAPEDV